MGRVMSALAHYSPVFVEAFWSMYPLVQEFGRDEVLAFETSCAFVMQWM